jgi:chromosomal replication initiation ATPase DnaA
MNIHPYIYCGLENSQVLNTETFLKKVMNTICEQKGIHEIDVLSRSREHSLVMARHQIAYILRQKTKLSSTFIGLLLNRDHATILHSVALWKDLLATDKNIAENHFKIMQKLNFSVN